MSWADINFDPAAQRWLVQGLVPKEGIGVIHAAKKSYETFTVLDLGVALAPPYAEWTSQPDERAPYD